MDLLAITILSFFSPPFPLPVHHYGDIAVAGTLPEFLCELENLSICLLYGCFRILFGSWLISDGRDHLLKDFKATMFSTFLWWSLIGAGKSLATYLEGKTALMLQAPAHQPKIHILPRLFLLLCPS